MSKPLFLVIVGLISAGVFLNGMRFARMDRNPFEGKRLFGMPVQGSSSSVEQLNRMGKVQMILAPVLFLVFAAILSGAFGPVEIR